MKKYIFLFFSSCFLILSSCQISKKLLTTDSSKKTTITERKQIIRKGDSLSIIIPNVKYRDTTITRVNYNTKTIARVVYDKQGNQRVDCISAEITEKLETIREIIKNDIKTKTEKKNEFNPQYFLYAIAALVIVIIIALILFYVMMIRFQSKIL